MTETKTKTMNLFTVYEGEALDFSDDLAWQVRETYSAGRDWINIEASTPELALETAQQYDDDWNYRWTLEEGPISRQRYYVSDADIRALRMEAEVAGDEAQVDLCDIALETAEPGPLTDNPGSYWSQEEALRECYRIIRTKRDQDQ